VQIFPGGLRFASGRYLGAGGKNVAFLESTLPGVTCNSINEVVQMTVGFTPAAHTIIDSTMPVLGSSSASIFTNGALLNIDIEIFKVQTPNAFCGGSSPLTIVATQIAILFTCNPGLLCTSTVASYALSDPGCVVPGPITYTLTLLNTNTEVFSGLTMPLDVFSTSFTPTVAQVGQLLLFRIDAMLYYDSVLLTKTQLLYNVTVVLASVDPCLSSLTISGIPTIEDQEVYFTRNSNSFLQVSFQDPTWSPSSCASLMIYTATLQDSSVLPSAIMFFSSKNTFLVRPTD
jgi:hypothetical protein